MALPDPWKLNNDKPFELDKDGRGWSFPTANQGGNSNSTNQGSSKQNFPNYSMGQPNPDVPRPPQFNNTNQQVDQFDRNTKSNYPQYEMFDPKGRTKNPQGPDRGEFSYYSGQDFGSQNNSQNSSQSRSQNRSQNDLFSNTSIGGTGAIDWQSQNNRSNRGQNWRDAATRADNRLQHSERNGKYSTQLSALRGPTIKAEESFNSDIDQTGQVDNSFDNTLGNNNSFGPGSAVGNNNSVTIISQGGRGLNNLQSVAAYKALNNNEYEKSYQRMNGYGRTAGAIEQTEGQLGIVDRVSNIYNMAGLTQAYWNDKSMAHQADYLGDIWKEGGFEYQMPGAAKRLQDKTEQIAGDLDLGD